MREFLILGSSIVTPPSSSTPHHHHNPKPHKPPLSSLSPSTPPPSPPISAASSRPLPLTAAQTDLSGRDTHLEHFADLASNHAREGRLEDFVMIAETLVASGVEPERFVSALSVELVSEGICGCLGDRNVWGVVEVLRRLHKLGVSPLELVDGHAMLLLGSECRRIVKRREVEAAVELLEILAGLNFSVRELVDPTDVIKICVDKRKPNMAIRYACTLPHAEMLFCDIIKIFGKKKDLASALMAFEASQEKMSAPNMFVYRTIIDVCGLCRNYIKSRYIFEELLSQKVTPNIFVFNSLMNVNANDLIYTLQVYTTLKNLGVSADVASYNILLKACCKAGRVDLAQQIYKELQQLESTEVMKLDVFTYSTIIKVFADAKLWQMALTIKDDMLSAGVTPNTITWSSLISACAKAGQVEQAIQLFDEMLSAGCEPNSQCCNILLHACVEACQYDRAFRLFRSWKGSKVQDISIEDYNGETDNARGVEKTPELCITSKSNFKSNTSHLSFAKRFRFKPTTVTYNTLMKACGSDYYRAKEMMDEMKRLGLSPNQISWSILINICGFSGDVEGAIEILRSMHMAGLKPDVIAYTTVIKVCVESKNLKLAFSLFAEMKEHQIQPNLVTYNTLLRARNRYGSLHEVQQCLAIYQEMRKAGYKANDYYLKELIEEWCEGVIQNTQKNQEEVISSDGADSARPHSLLLEKVALHLEKAGESLTIDLQGLAKVEARIVVLAVLRMMKENYTIGDSVKDDLLIIFGLAKAESDSAETKVKNAIQRLLEEELGLEVLSSGPRNAVDSKTELEITTRRPATVPRLKVTKNSLYKWLRRRVGSTKS